MMKWLVLGLSLIQGSQAEVHSRKLSQIQFNGFYPEQLLGPITLISSNSFIPEFRFRPRASPPPTPIPRGKIVRARPGLMCPGSTIGCFQGHLRHCMSANMRQDDAKIVRRCDNGCKACNPGVPDVCISDRFGEDLCTSLAAANRESRTCEARLEGYTGCFGGPDVGYCYGGQVYLVDYCGYAGCVGSPNPDQCNPTVSTPPPTAVVAAPSQDMCPGTRLVCWAGHIRLCLQGSRKDYAFVMQDCRSQGCSTCTSGPDMCNDPDGSSVCTKAPASQYLATCSTELQQSSYCDGSNVRVCDTSGQGTLVEYCADRGCQAFPPQCNRPLPSDQICQGTYVHCFQGHIRLCRDKEPIAQSNIIHNCRDQGCSACPNAPAICNNEQKQSQCTAATPDRYAATCLEAQSETTICTGTDVRHCDPSGRAFLVEYCANRGCSRIPLACNPPALAPSAQVPAPTPQAATPTAQAATPTYAPVSPSTAFPTIAVISPTAAPPTGKGKLGKGKLGKGKLGKGKTTGPPTFGAVETPFPTPGQALPAPPAPTPVPVSTVPPTPAQTAAPAPAPAPAVNCGPRVRMEWGALPDSARAQYVRALLALYQRGDMDALARLHFDNKDLIHGNGVIQFLIWHRVFLVDFEERLRSLPGNECMTIPYWNYDYSGTPNDRRSVFGTSATKLGMPVADCIGGAFASIQQSLDEPAGCIRRNPNLDITSTLRNSMFVDLCQIGEQEPLTFAANLQNTHGYPHVGFGGLFSTHFSPIDPLFMVHHANIDRIWDLWQDCHSNYQWFEPGGLNAKVVYYGSNAGDFIDNTQYTWKGKTSSLSYSSDQFSNPSVYSSDFRRNILTRCRDGRLRRYTTPNPVLGVDDAWTRGFQDRTLDLFPGSAPTVTGLNLKEQDVPLTCERNLGISDVNQLPNVGSAIGIYDNFSVQECLSKCASFYFKATGESNCICLTPVDRTATVSVNLTGATVKRYFPSCSGTEGNYGLYQTASQAGRRLQARFAGAADDSAFTFTALDRNVTGARATNSLTSASSAVSSNSNATNTAIGTAINSNITNTAQTDVSTNLSVTSVPETATSAPSSALNTAPTSALSSAATSANNNNNTSAAAAAAASAPLVGGANSQRLCFEAVSNNGNRTSIACSTRSVTPIPLPAFWLEMNNLKASDADACRNFRPAVGSKPIDCLNQ